ncbi:Mur ligase family protein [Alkaliphilus crotonatoxidans]
MILKELIQGLDIVKLDGNDDLEIDNIHNNSKDVTENSLFICIRGFQTDGHLYVSEAIQRGAKAILCEVPIQAEDATVIRVRDCRRAMAQIATNFYHRPSEILDVIGVTGTNGKTSITYMIKAILEEAGRRPGLMGTLATLMGDERVVQSRTTPESIDIQRQFRKMLDYGLDSCVMEVSSHSLELSRVEGIAFKIGIFTNLTPDHLDFHLNLR